MYQSENSEMKFIVYLFHKLLTNVNKVIEHQNIESTLVILKGSSTFKKKVESRTFFLKSPQMYH